jgi:UDP-N-acetylmuramate: L-alanyl-gamma-D-glutamyl-meso-diaminopimelate ligase
MHIHILGICGTFMGGLAALAREAGHTVTGCDAGVYPPMSDQLRALGIDLIEGFGTEQMQLNPDLYVIGNVISRARLPDGTPKFPLMEAILNQGEPYTSGPQWLSEHVLQGRHVMAVAGTHGKTTTSSMLAWILEYAGLNPGYLIGGVPLNFETSARLGSPNPALFVIEADEYDTAFFDKRSKFVHYRPRTAVLNNLEFDHADIFEDLAAIERQFHHLLRTVPSEGMVIANGQDANIGRVLGQGHWCPVTQFGTPASQYAAQGTPSAFDVWVDGQKTGRVDWSLTGMHNQNNALAAIAAAAQVGVSPEVAARALCAFQNVKRRMEVRGHVNGVTVYDDFAHHPSAIQTTLEGLRQQIPASDRIFAIFEPRSNTMKLGSMSAQLPNALKAADHVFCYTAGLGWNPADALRELGERAHSSEQLDELVRLIVQRARPGDHLLCMSNGSFGNIHQQLLQELADKR